MRLSLRAKLLSIVATAALAFVVLLVTGALFADRIERQLATIEQQYVPKLALGPALEARFESIRRGFQDAVAAQDREALAANARQRDQLLRELAATRTVIEPAVERELRAALDAYYGAAHDVSARLIAGESGEALVDAMSAMQAHLLRASDLLRKATAFDERRLKAAFVAARREQVTAVQMRFAITIACLVAVLAISLWLSRSALRSLAELTAGFERIGRGEFAEPIRVRSRDEFGQVAQAANQMARRLEQTNAARDRSDWIKNGLAGLASELRGDLEPAEIGARVVRFVARYLDAPAGALYCATKSGDLERLGQYAREGAGETAPRFRLGEGLVGQAALQHELTVVTDVPEGYARVRSGLGESAPRAVVLLPLVHAGAVTGVLELLVWKEWTPLQAELLCAARETLAIALEVARAREALRDLLAKTQRQAERLASQEEALLAANEELQAQQEELREANDELRQQTSELEARQSELQRSNAELHAARERLVEKAAELTTVSAYKSQFLANMSHELRTPLNSMLLLSDLLAKNESGNLTDKQVEFCRTVNGAGRDLLALINQVLDLAKVEAGKQELQVATVEVHELAAYAERIFAPLARDKGLDFIVEVSQAMPAQIETDRRRVEQIMNNLLGNAIKFTERGTVTLRFAEADPAARLPRVDLAPADAVALIVEDCGVGIAPEHVERIFAPFEQVEAQPNRRYGGTGLGLTIARELAVLLGGQLTLHTELGKGSRFTCHLPRVWRTAPKAQRATVLPSARPHQTSASTGKPSLLIVEDDPVFASTLAALIGEQGLGCMTAVDGASGLALAKEQQPRGIILDIKLPDMDGFTVMQELRADPRTADIPVHFVSAMDVGERGLALGAIGYLTKPASRRDLLRVVESFAPRLSNRPCRVLIVEDDPNVAEPLAERLQGDEFQVRSVPRAGDALVALEGGRFDCMVLDLSLPDMDGLEFLAALAERRELETPPVVVHTGRALSKAEAQRLEAYTEAIVLKDGLDQGRLLEEIRLFARRLRDGRPARRRTLSGESPAHVRLPGLKILLVDDDMRTVYALSALLRAKSAEVLVADTGHAALALLAERPDVDVVLMDIMMPEMDGYEAMRRIREERRFADLPIVALTAKAMKGDREKCLEAGASDYLPKPVDPDALLELLHARLAHGASHVS